MVDLMMLHCKREMNGLNPCAFPCEPIEQNAKHVEENSMPSKGEKVEQQQSRINELMTRCDFGWKTPSTSSKKNKTKQEK